MPFAAVLASSATALAQIEVAADGSGDHVTIQAAIDAAPEGARIRVRAGRYTERLVVTRRVAILGEGRDVVQVVAPFDAPLSRPVLSVDGTGPVFIAGLQFGADPARKPKKPGASCLVRIDDADVRFRATAIVGGPGDGVTVSGASRLEMLGTLIAGVWGSGLRVVPQVGGVAPRVEVVDSEVRDVRESGIRIGAGTSLTLSRSRVERAALHGVRYAGAEVLLTGCRIQDCGIVGVCGSGGAVSRVEGNVFFANRISALRCGDGERAEFVGNTFARSGACGVEIRGADSVVLRRNLFVGGSVGVLNVPEVAKDGVIDLQGDRFVGVEDLVGGPQPATATDLVRLEPPVCVDIHSGDLTLRPDGSLREERVGAAEPLPAKSPWPVLPNERAWIDDSE